MIRRMTATVGNSDDIVLSVAIDPMRCAVTAYGREAVVFAAGQVIDRIYRGFGVEAEFVRRSSLECQIRIGGHPDRAEFIRKANGILGAHVVETREHTYFIETCIGVAIGADLPSGPTADNLVEYADAALCSALSRRFIVAYAGPTVAESVRGDVDLACRMKLSDDEDFFVVYQPLVDLPDRRVLGYESLLRWRTPEGIVSPDVFMTVAESTSMIVPLGRRSIREAVSALATDITPRHGPDAFISINLSTQQLYDQGIADYVVGLVDEFGVRAQQIWIEIRENEVINLDSIAADAIEQLHLAGCRICVDDLGSGFSALSYLRDLPVDVLKVDRSLIARLVDDGGINRSVVQAICDMARAAGIQTVAEGVEDAALLPELASLGFDVGQGFLFGRPADSPSA